MNLANFSRAMDDAELDPVEVSPEVVIGRRCKPGVGSTWVVYVAAVNAWAFELVANIEREEVTAVAEAVISWDLAMAEHQAPLPKIITKVTWAALIMNPCPLKEVIESAHPFAK